MHSCFTDRPWTSFCCCCRRRKFRGDCLFDSQLKVVRNCLCFRQRTSIANASQKKHAIRARKDTRIPGQKDSLHLSLRETGKFLLDVRTKPASDERLTNLGRSRQSGVRVAHWQLGHAPLYGGTLDATPHANRRAKKYGIQNGFHNFARLPGSKPAAFCIFTTSSCL